MGLDPERLWATVHEGDPVLELDEDTVAIEAWKRVGIRAERIVRARQGQLLAGGRDRARAGPCSEIFYDRGEEHGCGRADCRPGCECDRYMEFYNLVFMQYDLRPGNDARAAAEPRTSTRASASSAARASSRTSARSSTPTASG